MSSLKPIKDLFSGHAESYCIFRPQYPPALYERIFQEVESFRHAWDCATGNGQVAGHLADHFEHVVATDISDNQMKHAVKKGNIRYVRSRSEQTPFSTNRFDLIAAGQAIHWFDIEAFYHEVKRVGKPGSVIAVWAYGLLQINSSIDAIINHFYREVVGPYWDFERRYIDEKYKTIPLPFDEIQVKEKFSIQKEITLDDLIGYINTWSSVKKYQIEKNVNPVDDLAKVLHNEWPEGLVLAITPLFMRIGRVKK